MKRIAPRRIYGTTSDGLRVLVAAAGDEIPDGFDIELEKGENVEDFTEAATPAEPETETPSTESAPSDEASDVVDDDNAGPAPEVDYEELAPKDLKALLDERGVEYAKSAKKPRLVQLLEESDEAS